MSLRAYQKQIYQDVREAFRSSKSVMMTLPTGGGKTRVFAEMAKSAKEKGQTIWIMVPRSELMEQASKALADLGVVHGRIAPGFTESKAYPIHIVSKDTWIRRKEKIQNPPSLIIVDEAHIALDRYKMISEEYPDARFLGVTATPERLDGKGLSDVYKCLVEGPTIAELTELGYLSPMDYYQPPIDLSGLKQIGTEYTIDSVAKMLEDRKIYGETIQQYKKHADGKPTLVYCRSVKSAEETAHKFRWAGYRFESIDGKMTDKKRSALLDGMITGEIQGLTSCEILTYGLDIPGVECIIMLRPTQSRTIFMQSIGRGLRIAPNKEKCIILDHVGNLQQHGHPYAEYKWNFHGKNRRKREPDELTKIRLCPDTFLYCTKSVCTDCGNNKTGRKTRVEEIVNCELQKAEPPVALKDRPEELKQEFQDRFNSALDSAKNDMSPGKIGELLRISKQVGRQPMFVYWSLSEGRRSVNVPLLHEIARQQGYKKGWIWFKKQEIEKKLGRK